MRLGEIIFHHVKQFNYASAMPIIDTFIPNYLKSVTSMFSLRFLQLTLSASPAFATHPPTPQPTYR